MSAGSRCPGCRPWPLQCSPQLGPPLQRSTNSSWGRTIAATSAGSPCQGLGRQSQHQRGQRWNRVAMHQWRSFRMHCSIHPLWKTPRAPRSSPDCSMHLARMSLEPRSRHTLFSVGFSPCIRRMMLPRTATPHDIDTGAWKSLRRRLFPTDFVYWLDVLHVARTFVCRLIDGRFSDAAFPCFGDFVKRTARCPNWTRSAVPQRYFLLVRLSAVLTSICSYQ